MPHPGTLYGFRTEGYPTQQVGVLVEAFCLHEPDEVIKVDLESERYLGIILSPECMAVARRGPTPVSIGYAKRTHGVTFWRDIRSVSLQHNEQLRYGIICWEGRACGERPSSCFPEE